MTRNLRSSGNLSNIYIKIKSFEALRRNGGEHGIRTHERLSPLHAFQACALNHSANSPLPQSRRIINSMSKTLSKDKHLLKTE